MSNDENVCNAVQPHCRGLLSQLIFPLDYRPVKRVIPESIFTWPRGQVDAPSWDAALDVVQQSLLGMAVANDVNDEEDRVLTEVFKYCEKLRAKK